MSTTSIQAYYSPEETHRRYRRWARLNPDDHKGRTKAWAAYVDARDQLPEGTPAAATYEREQDLRQMGLFGGQR